MKMIYIGKSPKKQSDPHHCHKTWEIIISLSGEGYVDFDDGRVPFNETTVLCVPPGVNHSKHSDEGFCDVWIWVSDFPLDVDRVTVISDGEDKNILNVGKILYSLFHSETQSKSEIIDSLLESMKKMIISRLDKRQTDRRVERVRSEILQNFHNPEFSLTECLRRHGYCGDHMRRIFKDTVGMTPVEYLTSLRINTAKQLLGNKNVSNNTVSEICDLSGYNDVGYFSRIFKKCTGRSPSEYRESLKE